MNESVKAFKNLMIALIAWIIGYPLTLLVKRNPALTVVIGRQGRVFADNSKYFYIYASSCDKKNKNVIFLTTNREIRDGVLSAGGQAMLHPSWRSLYLLLKCNRVVVDMTDWIEFGAYQLSRGAKIIQLWHGAPLKQIELNVHQARIANLPSLFQFCLNCQKKILGRYPIYDVVLATSNFFIQNAFQKCFKARNFIASGYPRNDVLFAELKNEANTQLINLNVDIKTKEILLLAKNKGQKVGLFVPTFRKEMSNPFAGSLDLETLSKIARELNLLLVLKLHPFMQGRIKFDDYPNLINYEPWCDVYPIMPLADFLITDYSSIYFDYLLLDRPIVFWAPDLEKYLNQDRAMYFDYREIAPGPICSHVEEFKNVLSQLNNDFGSDIYSEQRAKIRRLTFDFNDGKSAERVYLALETL